MAKMLEVARSKMRYALTELENNELIHVVQKEEKTELSRSVTEQWLEARSR